MCFASFLCLSFLDILINDTNDQNTIDYSKSACPFTAPLLLMTVQWNTSL